MRQSKIRYIIYRSGLFSEYRHVFKVAFAVFECQIWVPDLAHNSYVKSKLKVSSNFHKSNKLCLLFEFNSGFLDAALIRSKLFLLGPR